MTAKKLSPRQIEVLKLMAENKNIPTIDSYEIALFELAEKDLVILELKYTLTDAGKQALRELLEEKK